MKQIQKEKKLVAMNVTQIDTSNYRKMIQGGKGYQGNNFQMEKFSRSETAFNNKKNMNVALAYSYPIKVGPLIKR